MSPKIRCIWPALVVSLCGCAHPRSSLEMNPKPQLFEGMGDHRRPVTTSVPLAQAYFDQGLIWAFAFNHEEAIRSFTEAARLDPNCAMAWWGIALCNGPHINRPAMTPEQCRAAWKALGAATLRAASASPVEQALIHALSFRYAEAPPSDRRELDAAYARAMRVVWESNRKDPDVGVLFAESMMDLRPWDLWSHEGKPYPGTEEIVSTLQEVLKLAPNHPGGLHLMIHAVEGSGHPEAGMDAADRLRSLVPSSGHLTHMPSHIDVRTGRWKEACEANERAIEVDRAYRKLVPKQGFYAIYMAHNHHFLSYAAMMEGRSELAIRKARDVIAGMPEEFQRASPELADPLLPVVLEALMRFGRWDEILREKEPAPRFPIARAMYHFTRGIAYAAKGNVADAAREQDQFRSAVTKVPEKAIFGINPAVKVLAIAEYMLEGEIRFRRGEIDAAVASLRKAVELEDGLIYTEPPDWVQPVRHTLGAVLVSAGRFDEAESVYREDLRHLPNNGWSLYGLAKCLREKGQTKEAAIVEEQFARAWGRADIQIGSSCLCASRKP